MVLKRDELMGMFETGTQKESFEESGQNQGNIKILDTSVIIDGRIADICQTGF